MSGDRLLYMYGFVLPAADLIGLEGVDPGSSVFLVEHEDVACAVTEVPAPDYTMGADTRSEAEQLEWITPRAWRHHEVLRTLHAAGAAAPLKFGTLAPDSSHVRALLQRLRQPIAELLARFCGKDEWTLRSRFDLDVLSRSIAGDRLHVVPSHADVPPADGHSFFARKRSQRLASESLDRRVLELAADVLQRMTEMGIETAPAAPPRARPADGHHVTTEMAILVSTGGLGRLDPILAALEVQYADAGLTLELIGPWPPYSFTATLDTDAAPQEAA